MILWKWPLNYVKIRINVYNFENFNSIISIKNFRGFSIIGVIASILFTTVLTNPNSFAAPINSHTEITPINNSIGLEKTTIQMHISENNKLPWGFVEGKIANHVAGHPVIIQIFDNDEIIPGNSVGAVHFAQTIVNEDGSYELQIVYF